MDVTQSIIIEGKIVEHLGGFEGVSVYTDQTTDTDDDITIYLCKKGRVKAIIKVEACCSQNVGYIASTTFQLII